MLKRHGIINLGKLFHMLKRHGIKLCGYLFKNPVSLDQNLPKTDCNFEISIKKYVDKEKRSNKK